MNMEIAGVNFAVKCLYPVSTERLSVTYGQFIKRTITPGADINVNVRIETGAMPDTRQMTRIFDTGQSWSMFRRHDDYFLALKIPTANGRTLWLAAFDALCDNISIYCSDLLMGTEDGHTTCYTPLSYPLDQLLLMYILVVKKGALLHAAGAGINNSGCIFPGRSGAGKSTLSRLFLGKGDAEMLSDDRIVIRKTDGTFRAFGTPWAGDAGIAENNSFPLSGIFFIRHSEQNVIKAISPKKAVEKLMPVTSIPWHDEKAIQSMLAFCEDLVLNIPSYELHFRPEAEIVTLLEDFLAGNNI